VWNSTSPGPETSEPAVTAAKGPMLSRPLLTTSRSARVVPFSARVPWLSMLPPPETVPAESGRVVPASTTMPVPEKVWVPPARLKAPAPSKRVPAA